MRRLIPAVAVVLLVTACSSAATHATNPPASAVLAPPSISPPPSTATSSAAAPSLSQSQSPASSPASQSPSSAAAGPLVIAIPASQLPDEPAPGAPALDNVSITKSKGDPCGIPADNSGGEAQLIDAEKVGPVLVVTFEVTNPCTVPLSYDVTVTQAIGSATGPSGGPDLRTTTPMIQPGKSVPFKVNIDPNPALTPAQLQQLWVGATHIAKHSAG